MKNNIVIRDDEYEKIMLGKEWNNGDWNLRLATKVMFMEQYVSDEELKETGRYSVEILAVSPEACNNDKVKEAIDDMGLDEFTVGKIPFIEYEAMIEQGLYAPLWNKSGNNLKKLLSEANERLQIIYIMFGFFMDKHVNMIGDTGWDWIAGDIGASMRRWQEEQNENSN